MEDVRSDFKIEQEDWSRLCSTITMVINDDGSAIVIIESISRSRSETREYLWVSVDLVVIWNLLGYGLDPKLDNLTLSLNNCKLDNIPFKILNLRATGGWVGGGGPLWFYCLGLKNLDFGFGFKPYPRWVWGSIQIVMKWLENPIRNRVKAWQFYFNLILVAYLYILLFLK